MRKYIVTIIIIAALGLIGYDRMSRCEAIGASAEPDPYQQGIAEKILRFHILANSDSDKDQKVKEKVRDAIGNYLAPQLEEARDLSDTKNIVTRHMDEIVTVAEETLEKEGYSYGASARLATVDFPVKTDGSYTFPAGEYEALEITLGEGNGHNWWCVLYPNMCFQGTVYEVVEEEADEALREVLTPEEYADVFNERNYQIRFRFAEVLQKWGL